jgi:pimeloyl-ACP methyl ester carboxylesterase
MPGRSPGEHHQLGAKIPAGALDSVAPRAQGRPPRESEPDMPIFPIAGHWLHYELYGDPGAPPLVLLHEGLGSASQWLPQIDHFSRRFRVLAFDRWGYGAAAPRERFGPRYLDDDAGETIALLDELGVRDACLLGHSDGGTIALLVAARRPVLVRRLVLEAAHIYTEPSMQRGVEELRRRLRTRPRVQEHLKRLHGERGIALAEAWLARWLDEPTAPERLVDDAALARIGCPALVIQGDEDEYATVQHARDLHAALARGELWLIPGVGHVPHAELGEEFNRRVAAFLLRPD